VSLRSRSQASHSRSPRSARTIASFVHTRSESVSSGSSVAGAGFSPKQPVQLPIDYVIPVGSDGVQA